MQVHTLFTLEHMMNQVPTQDPASDSSLKRYDRNFMEIYAGYY